MLSSAVPSGVGEVSVKVVGTTCGGMCGATLDDTGFDRPGSHDGDADEFAVLVDTAGGSVGVLISALNCSAVSPSFRVLGVLSRDLDFVRMLRVTRNDEGTEPEVVRLSD